MSRLSADWKVYGPDLNGRFGGLQGTGGLEATVVDASGATKGVLNDQFGNGVASVSGGTVSWFATRVGAYGPLPSSQAEVLTDITRVAEATAWRSRRMDATGFYYLGARYYDSTSGRFLSADPRGHGASMSLYDFANGDPVNYFDADGRCATKFGNGAYDYGEQVGENIWKELKGVPKGAQAIDELVLSLLMHPLDTVRDINDTTSAAIDNVNRLWAGELLDYNYRIPKSSQAVGDSAKAYVDNFGFEDYGALGFTIIAGKAAPEIAPMTKSAVQQVASPKTRILAGRVLDVVNDAYGVYQNPFPDYRTMTAPEEPAAIVQTIDPKPPAVYRPPDKK